MKILFMGTPEFAVLPLKKLIEHKHDIVAVVSTPDKPQGRHMILTPTPVKAAAIEMGLKVYTPEKLKNGAFEETLKETAPELIVVVAYGKILPDYILGYPKFGCINLHGSLLPRYRGAAPIQRAIMNGDDEIGITVMYMAAGLDTGDMISFYKEKLSDEMTFKDVSDRLSENGGELLAKTVDELQEKGRLPRIPQDDSQSSYAAKIEAGDMLIDFGKTSREVHNQIRALYPSVLAYAFLNGKKVKICLSEIVEEDSENSETAGKIVSFNKKGITVLCRKGSILLKVLVPEGKKQMDAFSFINGRGAAVGDFFRTEI